MADVSLNGLKVKTDSLPNDWYVSLINPQSGEPAEIMTVARFVELLTGKIPVAINTMNGLMSYEDRVRLPLGVTRDSSYQTVHIAKFSPLSGAVLILAEASTESRVGGFGILQVSAGKESFTFKYTTLGETHSASEDGYLSTPIYVLYNSDKTCDVYAKNIQRPEKNRFGILALATSTPLDLYKVDNIPADAVPVKQQRFSFTQAVLSASSNALTDTISENYSVLPPPANCVPNYSKSAGSEDQFAVSAISETDNPDGSIPVNSEPQEQYVWSIDKIGKAVLELQEENKRLKQILNIFDDSEVQQM